MAGSYNAPLADDDEGWQSAWEMWALSAMRLMRLAVPHLRARGGGSIVNITSCGVHQLVPETALSEVPRLATTGFTKYMAAELAPENIRINNVLPGWIATERADLRFRTEAERRGVRPEDVYAEEAAPIPLGRFGTPEEIGNAIAFLVSERATYISGVNLRIDGAWCNSPTA
jgi:3-oxoacyl-[acyl-carrier protein] reductase